MKETFYNYRLCDTDKNEYSGSVIRLSEREADIFNRAYATNRTPYRYVKTANDKRVRGKSRK